MDQFSREWGFLYLYAVYSEYSKPINFNESIKMYENEMIQIPKC